MTARAMLRKIPAPTDTSVVLAWAALLVLALTGCEDQSTSTGTGAANTASGEPVTPYQNIPPAWCPDGGDGPLAPSALHLLINDQTSRGTYCIADARTAEACVAERLVDSVRIQPGGWLGAPAEFKASDAWSQQCRLTEQGSPLRPLVVGDSDRACAVVWVILQMNGQPPPLMLWQGMPAATTAHWPMVINEPEAADDPGRLISYTGAPPPPPAWLMETPEFDALTAGLSPVSGGNPVSGEPHPAPAGPAAIPGEPVLPGLPLAPTDPTAPATPAPTPTAPLAEPAPATPSTAVPTHPTFVFCGSLAEWQTDAQQDQLLRGLLRIPPGELYSQSTGTLLTPAVIQSRVKVLGLGPATPIILMGRDSEAICQVYMALTHASFKNLRVYFR